MASLQKVDDTDLKTARAEVEAFRELDESVLAAMGEKELSAHASLASRADASTQYMDLVYSHLKDAAIEEKVVCYAEVGFEVSGGGGGKDLELQKKNKAKWYLEQCIANGGSKTKEPQRDLTSHEKESGLTVSGVLDKFSSSNGRRKLTEAEIRHGKILVHQVWNESAMNGAKSRLAELVAAKEAYMEDIYMFRRVLTDLCGSYLPRIEPRSNPILP